MKSLTEVQCSLGYGNSDPIVKIIGELWIFLFLPYSTSYTSRWMPPICMKASFEQAYELNWFVTFSIYKARGGLRTLNFPRHHNKSLIGDWSFEGMFHRTGTRQLIGLGTVTYFWFFWEGFPLKCNSSTVIDQTFIDLSFGQVKVHIRYDNREPVFSLT